MRKSAFERLAPFIQEHIYRNRWTEMREIQVAACEVIFGSDSHLLLASGTASGKTEAAFLPAITKIYEEPASSVGILYVSPLKALINDQFLRLDELCKESRIPVTKWHGDVSAHRKNKLLSKPQGILQTTPESLEAMLMRRPEDVTNLFSDLRFLIIDEVHYFMESERGLQLQCILERIRRLSKSEPRRIGLSATLGDYRYAEEWLCAGTGRACSTPVIKTQGSKVKLHVHHISIPELERDGGRAEGGEMGDTLAGLTMADMENGDGHTPAVAQFGTLTEYYQYLFHLTKEKRCIIFSSTKAEVEKNAANLKRIAQRVRYPDVYHVHHGSLSKALREDTEQVLKDSLKPAVTCASVTLELGIDIGSMERIVQTGPVYSVSSFVQRLGRSGRRGQAPEMGFVFREFVRKSYVDFVDEINWDFLRTIAIIQLYLQERWIEPAERRKKPYSLLYHQTMSELYSRGSMSAAQLAQTVLTLPPFQDISQDTYRKLLWHLISTNHLELTEERDLALGETGERLTNHYEFFSIFEASKEYSVRSGAQEIGSVTTLYPEGFKFALAGKTWEVFAADEEHQIIDVIPAKELAENSWRSLPSYFMHQKVVGKMRDILDSEENYPYLSQNAFVRLQHFRTTARRAGITEHEVVKLSGQRVAVFPWLGEKALKALSHVLEQEGHLNRIRDGLVIEMEKAADVAAVEKVLRKVRRSGVTVDGLALPPVVAQAVSGKYNEYLPEEMLVEEYREDWLDVRNLGNN